MATANKYQQLFDYLAAPNLPTDSEAAIVFGRKDARIAHALGDLVIPNLVTIAVISGGIGKDSGDIRRLGYNSEADYLHESPKRCSDETVLTATYFNRAKCTQRIGKYKTLPRALTWE